MHNITVIKNYGHVLFDCAKEQNVQEEVMMELNQLQDMILKIPEFINIMDSQIIQKSKKIEIASIIFVGMSNILKNFFISLIKYSRISIFNDVIAYYDQLLKESKNIRMVEVITSKILTNEERNKLHAQLEQKMNQKLEINFDSDYSLLGGIVIRYNNNLIDLSIAGMLDKIKQNSKQSIVTSTSLQIN